MHERLVELEGQLDAAADALGDLAMDSLREAVRSGSSKRPELERLLTRARSAVVKAEQLVRQAAETAATAEAADDTERGAASTGGDLDDDDLDDAAPRTWGSGRPSGTRSGLVCRSTLGRAPGPFDD